MDFSMQGNPQIANTLMGFMKGKHEKAKFEREQQAKKPMLDLQREMLKLQIQNAKVKQQQENIKANLVDVLIKQWQAKLETAGQEQAEGQAPQQPEIQSSDMPPDQEAQGQGFVDMAASMDPTIAAVLKMQTGIDFPKARHDQSIESMSQKRYEQQKRANDLREKALTEGYNTVTIEEPGGGQRIVSVPKVLSQRPSLNIQTKVGETSRPIKDADRTLWINPDTMQRPPVGMSPRDAEAAGFMRISTSQQEKIQKIDAVQKIIETVQKLMEETIPKKDTTGRLGGLLRSGKATLQFGESGKKLAVMRDFIQGNRSQVAKALGEVGNLSETEQEAVTKMFGDISDAGEKAWMQFDLLKETFKKAKQTAFGISKKDYDMIYNPQTGKLEPAK